jgi:alkylated DNA repair dioxygenase AlkB
LTADAIRVALPDADVRLYREAFASPRAAELFARLRAELDWQGSEITLFGRKVASPRLSAWYGDAAYTYSGLTWLARPMPEVLSEIRRVVEKLAGQPFNTVLANLYRSGSDSMGWHADDEPELGPDPVIASVVFGETRRFLFRRKKDKAQKLEVGFTGGDVMVMGKGTQCHWLHAVPKTARPVGERINLTFRRIAPGAGAH